MKVSASISEIGGDICKVLKTRNVLITRTAAARSFTLYFAATGYLILLWDCAHCETDLSGFVYLLK
jgi:hypothetical protein